MRKKKMKRKGNIAWKVITGLYLLNLLRHRVTEGVREFSSQARSHAQDVFNTASERAGRASDVIRGHEQRRLVAPAAVLIGFGIGFGAGMLLAPATGKESRAKIATKLRDRINWEKQRGTFKIMGSEGQTATSA
jgi:hypothetical protein